jgi:hypothetical protein
MYAIVPPEQISILNQKFIQVLLPVFGCMQNGAFSKWFICFDTWYTTSCLVTRQKKSTICLLRTCLGVWWWVFFYLHVKSRIRVREDNLFYTSAKPLRLRHKKLHELFILHFIMISWITRCNCDLQVRRVNTEHNIPLNPQQFFHWLSATE